MKLRLPLLLLSVLLSIYCNFSTSSAADQFRTLTDGQTVDWSGPYWSTSAGAPGSDEWTDGNTASISSGTTTAATMNIAAGGISADGVKLTAGLLVLDGGALTLTGTATIDVAVNGVLTINNSISSASKVTFNSSGTPGEGQTAGKIIFGANQTLTGIAGNSSIDLTTTTLIITGTDSAFTGTLTSSGTGSKLILGDGATLTATINRTSNVSEIDKIELGNNASLTVKGADASKSSFIGSVSGGDNSKLYIHLNKYSSIADQSRYEGFIDLTQNGGTGVSDVYLTNDSTLGFNSLNNATVKTNLGKATLHIGNGMALALRPGIKNTNLQAPNFSSPMKFGSGTITIRNNGNVAFVFGSDISLEDGVAGSNIVTTNIPNQSPYTQGTIAFTGTVNLGTGTVTSTAAEMGFYGNTTIGTVAANAGKLIIGGVFAGTNANSTNGELIINDNANATIDTISAQTGTITFEGKATATSEINVRTATMNFNDGANVETVRFVTSNASATTSRVYVNEGSTLTITGNSTAETSHAFMLGRYSGTSASYFTMTGGTVNAVGAELQAAWNATSTIQITGGKMNVKGVNFGLGSNAGTSNGAFFYFGTDETGLSLESSTGTLNVGTEGWKNINTANKTSIYLGKGTIGTIDGNWASSGDKAITMASSSGTAFDTGAHNITINNTLEGVGKLVKKGTGTLELLADNNTHGSTVLTQGNLRLKSALSAGRELSIQRSSGDITLTLDAATYSLDTGRTLNISGTAGTVTLPKSFDWNGGLLTVDINALTAPGNATPYLTVTGDINLLGDASFALAGDAFGTFTIGSQYLVATATGTITGFDQHKIISTYLIPGFNDQYSYKVTTLNNGVYLTIESSRESITWNNAAGGTWDTTTNNWKGDTSGNPAKFENGARISFVDLGTGDITISLADTYLPSSILFNNSTNNYIFTGANGLSGIADITKQGTGNVTFDINNSAYAGLITLEGGSLTMKNAQAIGLGNVNFSGGTLVFDLDGTVNLNSVGGTSTVLLDVGEGKTVTLTSTQPDLFAKNITIGGKGTLNMGADDATFGGNLLLSGDGSLILKGTTYNGGIASSADGSLTATGTNFNGAMSLSGDGSLTLTGTTFGGTIDNSGTGSLTATGTTFNGNTTLSGEGTLKLNATTVNGALTNTSANQVIDIYNSASNITFGGIKINGTVAISGGKTLMLPNGAFNNSSGELIIRTGSSLQFTTASTYSGNLLNLTLEDGTSLYFGDGNASCKITSTATLKMGANTTATLMIGAGGTVAMNIVLTGGVETDGVENAPASIVGFHWGNNTTLTGKISGTGNFLVRRNYNSGYATSSRVTFQEAWINNDYVGNSYIYPVEIVYNVGSATVATTGQKLSPWGGVTSPLAAPKK